MYPYIAPIYPLSIYIYIYCALRSQPPPPQWYPPPTPPMICCKSANSHRDQPRQGRHPRNCRRFWSRKASILVTVVTVGPSCRPRASKVPTVTGIGVVLIAILRTVLTFDPSCCRRASDVSTDYKCIIFFRHFWPLMFLSRFRCIDRSTITGISLL